MAVGLVIETCGGVVPTQATGFMDGHPFYFRARHGDWDLNVTEPGTDCVMPGIDDVVLQLSGDDPTHGWMEEKDVEAILQDAYKQFLEAKNGS